MTPFLMKADHVRRITPDIDPKRLETDLNRFCETAIKSGAETATVINAGDVVFSSGMLSRVAADDGYLSIHWPLDYPKDDIMEAVNGYQKGVFFRVKGDKGMPEFGGGPFENAVHRKTYLKVYEIVTLLESASFYCGYHLAVGFAAGNCRAVFCSEEKRCLPMLKGKACIHPNKGRPSMEAAGMEADAMAAKIGWSPVEDGSAIYGLLLVA